MSMTGVVIAITTFVLLTVGSSFLSFKSRRVRTVIQGEPLIIVQDGKPVEHNLQRERLTLDDVMEEARGSEVETVDEIKWAVLEASGKISFIKK
jgi:uncharacterized membrane protein YcaP (DUF421 family)